MSTNKRTIRTVSHSFYDLKHQKGKPSAWLKKKIKHGLYEKQSLWA